MKDGWDRAVSAERRRCKRMGYIFDQPAGDWREDDYRVGDLVKLGNVKGLMATYRVGPGRITSARMWRQRVQPRRTNNAKSIL